MFSHVKQGYNTEAPHNETIKLYLAKRTCQTIHLVYSIPTARSKPVL